MKKEQLVQIQQVMVNIMDEIHKVCINNGLTYYLIGGSALGAVRHKGFIPWDIDIDIAMPRKDYELFINIYSKKLPNNLCCLDYRNNKHHFSPHALVLLKESILLSQRMIDENVKQGIFVDILPLDQVPDNRRLMEKQRKALLFINNIKYYKHSQFILDDSVIEICAKKIVRLLLSLFSDYYLNKKQQQIAQQYNTLDESNCPFLCSTLSHYNYYKLCMSKYIMGNPKLMDFSGRKFFVPNDVERYLSQIFGDFLKLPTSEEQKNNMMYWKYAEWIDEEGEKHVISTL